MRKLSMKLLKSKHENENVAAAAKKNLKFNEEVSKMMKLEVLTSEEEAFPKERNND